MHNRLQTAVLLGCALTACQSVPTAPDVAQQVVDARAAQVKSRWQHAQPQQLQEDEANPSSIAWWQAWHDAQLNTLIELALANNRDIAKARAAITASRALSVAQRANEKPQFSAGTEPRSNPETTRSYVRIGLQASWESLLFGARANQLALTQIDVQAAQLSADATRFLVTTQVAEHLIHSRGDHKRMKILRQQEQLGAKNLSLISVRIAQGLASASERQIAETQSQIVQVQLAKLAFNILTDDQAIRVLTAQPILPRSAPATWALPTAPLTSVLPMPLAVMRLRPDIALAEQEVFRAGAQLGMARTEMYPHVALAGAIGAYIGGNGSIRLRPELGPVIDIPLFDWGARRAKVTAQEQALESALLSYQQSLQTALGEVELALSKLTLTQNVLQQAKLQTAAAKQVCIQAAQSKRQAQASQIDVNNAAIALGNAKLAQIDAELDYLLAQIALRLALGT